ncbi:hypothetical protein HDG35_005900 [Paraburkholderia sp. JPY681]|nr:hypothetical protein [Paraburkholderia atlantica]
MKETKTAAGASLSDEQIRKSMTSEQIQLERRLTCEAIDGAMAFGYQNTNPPPGDDHWLAPYWKIGRKQAELEASIAAPKADAAPSDEMERAYQRRHAMIVTDREDFEAGYRAAIAAGGAQEPVNGEQS